MTTIKEMTDPTTVISVILTAASLLYSEKTRRAEKKANRYDEMARKADERDAAATKKDATATTLLLGRERFAREITGKFKTIGN